MSGEARVSMPLMARAALFTTAALLLGACASSTPPSEPSGATDEAIAGLETRMDELASDLASQAEDDSKLADRISALGDKLDRSLERLRTALDDVRAGSADARDQAAAALASAQSVASDLSVLEERYEYHLRRYHGGGG